MSNPPDELTPGLQRQLEHLELLGNAEAELAAAELRERRPRVLVTHQVQEKRHRYLQLKRRYEREALRTRTLSLWMLMLAPIGIVMYLVFGENMPQLVALLILLVSALLLGLAFPFLYFANNRLQELEELR